MMAIEIIDCEQGSEAWLLARLGIPTASEFGTLMMSGRKKGEISKTRQKYLYRLLGERMTGRIEESFRNSDTERGHELEPEAVELYAMLTDTEPTKVGFIRNGEKGCSPDRLIGENGLVQIKTTKPEILIAIHENGGIDDHKPQCQGELWVSEREWNDLFVYWPGLPPFTKRYYRDETYIKTLSEATEAFLSELHELENKYRCAA